MIIDVEMNYSYFTGDAMYYAVDEYGRRERIGKCEYERICADLLIDPETVNDDGMTAALQALICF